MSANEREIFEQSYKQWIVSITSEIAVSMRKLEPPQVKELLERCEGYKIAPPSMYDIISDDVRARMGRMVGGDRLQGILMLSSNAVAFSPSIFMQRPSVLDYTIAMNRRFFFKTSWFSIIVVSQSYIEQATDEMLHFVLEHELIQNAMYTEHVERYGHLFLSPDEKRTIDEKARQQAIEQSGITEEEHLREQELMDEIATYSPLVPKSFAETSLFEYLEKYWDDIKDLGVKGETESEKEFEAMISQNSGWLDFSHETYGLFLAGLKRELDLTYLEYGYV
ncbi:MAG: hypothetical protein U9N36_09890 [Euryarchaeota archaeon]|nr:hypothetical protein [Euryarchaeota archaeon]